MDQNNDRRTIKRRQEDECPHNCIVCYRYNLQMKWLLIGASGAITVLIIFSSLILNNKSDVSALAKEAGVARTQVQYMVESLHEIKKAMGLEIRLPSKLEELKNQ